MHTSTVDIDWQSTISSVTRQTDQYDTASQVLGCRRSMLASLGLFFFLFFFCINFVNRETKFESD